MYGIFSYNNDNPRVGFKYSDRILDLEKVRLLGHFDSIPIDEYVFLKPVLNDFIRLGQSIHRSIGQRINALLANDAVALANVQDQVFVPQSKAKMHLPVSIGDYTDFYAGIHHAENVGRIFRPDGPPLPPNYKHMPVAYHGRASSIVVSGTPIRRPTGQFLVANGKNPELGPTRALDFELELGLIIGKQSAFGQSVPVEEAEDYIFGITVFNDWSARDIQRWEYQPLGPFLGKNFGSTLSAWVLPFYELEPVRIAGPIQEPTPLPYLQIHKPGHFAIDLEVWLQPAGGDAVCICRTNAQYLYWNFAQMIAHHTIGGCNLNVGDVLATGTISGTLPNSYGSLLELTWNGERAIALSDTCMRTFLADGDTVTLRAFVQKDGNRIELGPATGVIQS
jgi:fumarylacetoacetase